MTTQMSVMNPSSDAKAFAPVEERMIQSVRLHYQTDHQEEFLRLKAQVESLLTELNTLAIDAPKNSQEAL